MTNVTLTQLYNLAADYDSLLQEKIMDDDILMEKFMDYLGNDADGEKIQETFEDLAVDYDEKKADAAAFPDAFARAAIRLMEFNANLAAKAGIDENLLAGLVEPRDRSAEVSAAFLANNAPVLAKLFAPKAP